MTHRDGTPDSLERSCAQLLKRLGLDPSMTQTIVTRLRQRGVTNLVWRTYGDEPLKIREQKAGTKTET